MNKMKTYGIFVAPWDLQDVGPRELFTWVRDQGLNSVYLASVYHAGWFLHPHNKGHKAYMVEDGACYFHPNLKEYAATRLKPTVASMACDRDWCAEACEIARGLGLKIFLWTVCLHNTRLGRLHPEATCRNAFGDSYPHALCPTHPAVREYLKALVRDQARQYHPDGLLLEATGYHRGRTHGNLAGGIAGHHHERDGLPMPALEQSLLNLSFAASDLAFAEEQGVEATRLRSEVKEHLEAFFQSAPKRPPQLPATLEQFHEAHSELAKYERCQQTACESLVTELKMEVVGQGVSLQGDCFRRAFDAVFVGAYNQPVGEVENTVKRSMAQRRSPQQVIVGLRLGFNPPPAALAINSLSQACQITRRIADSEADGMAFYIYGEAPTTCLEWIGPAIKAAAPRATEGLLPRPRRNTGTMQIIRVGLIGAGAIGAVHLAAFKDTAGVLLTGVMDVNLDKARQLAQRFGIPFASDDCDALLARDDIDLVVVATTPQHHAAIAKRVRAAGKHLLMEKPLGSNLQEADQILDACLAGRQAAGVPLIHRYDGTRYAARELIRSGAIGKICFIRHRFGLNMYSDPRFATPERVERSWLTDPSQAGGGMLPSASIHSLSVLSFLLDHPRFRIVRGAVRHLHPRAFKGIEDDVTLLLTLDAGVEIMFEESWATDLPYESVIHGDRGHLAIRGPTFVDVGLAGQAGGPVPENLRPYAENSKISWRPHELDELIPPGFAGLADDMIGTCRGEHRPDLPTVLHARNMRAVIAAAIDSSGTGNTAQISWRG